MRTSQYKALMDTLDAALDNEYDEILEWAPERIYEDIVNETGDRTWEDVPTPEIYRVIQQWQEKHS